MKTVLIIAMVAIFGYTLGLLLEIPVEAEESKLVNFATTGTFGEQWIPFFLDEDVVKIAYLQSNAGWGFRAPLPLITLDELSEDQKKKKELGPCDCTRPTIFTVTYDGPVDDVTVKIFKKLKNGITQDFVFDVLGTFDSGDPITINSIDDFGRDQVHSDTVYQFLKDGNPIGSVKIHTSCSKPLVIDDTFFFREGQLGEIKLTLVSGFDLVGSQVLLSDRSCSIIEEGESPIDTANVAIDISVNKITTVGGKKILQNVVDQCIFHSPQSFEPLCVICQFTNSDGTVILGEGAVIELDKGYTASEPLLINIQSVPEVDVGTLSFNDIQDVGMIHLELCELNCDCQKPTVFTVTYEGPKNGVTVKIFKKISKDGTPKDFIFDVPGFFNSGQDITIDSRDFGRDQVHSNTVYQILKGGNPIGVLQKHTSCSKPLFIGDTFFFKKGDPDEIKLTVVSGLTLEGFPAIPDSICRTTEVVCTKPTEFTVTYEGPENGVSVKIFKKISKNGALKDLIFDVPGFFNSGQDITIDSTDFGRDRLHSNTVYQFLKGVNPIGSVQIHTSCSQPLFIGDMFFFEENEPEEIKLTVVSGFDSGGFPAIP